MERAEVERLRSDVQGTTATLDVSDELKTSKADQEALVRQLEASRKELARSNELVAELRADLRMAEKELDGNNRHSIRRDLSSNELEVLSSPGTMASDLGGIGGLRRERTSLYRKNSTPVQQTSQDLPNLLASPGRRDSVASNSSKRSIGAAGGRDEVATLREQIVGLKVIIETLTLENHELAEKNKVLLDESAELK